MVKLVSWLRSVVGFLVATGAGLFVTIWLTRLLGVDSAGETARYFSFIYALVGSLHLKILSELSALRDVGELNRDERLALRTIITSRSRQIWGLLAVLLGLALLGVFARGLSSLLGEPIVWVSWLGVCWALYSLLLLAGWHQEIAEFKSVLFERKRCTELNREELEALRKDGWVPAEGLKKFTDDPPAGNHTLCA